MDLNNAIQAHGEWKLKLRMAIQKSEKLDVPAISADNKCALGQWLHGEAKMKFGALKSYGDCVQKHAAFHREAAKVGTSINSGDMKTASAALENGTPYTNASSAVAVAILALKKEASL